MLVMKFGGTSVSSKDTVETICKLAMQNLAKQPVIVVSALSRVTDLLVSLCGDQNANNIDKIISEIYSKHQALGEQVLDSIKLNDLMNYVSSSLNSIRQLLEKHYKDTNKTANQLALKDEIVFYGERMSSYLIALAINQHTSVPARQILATSCIVTNKKFGSADYIRAATKANTKKIILPLVKAGIVPVITGFVGATRSGETTTLGRGGSDYSASILGEALDASEIQIWTDVDGVYSSDPRMIKSAKLLPILAYEEASELANLGAKVLHPRTIKPAISAKIPVRVLNTFNPKVTGTKIVAKIDEVKYQVRAITTREFVPLVTIKSHDMLFGKGFLKKIFTIFANYNISVSLISVSEVSVSITLDNMDNIELALKDLNKFGTVIYEKSYGSLSLVGGQIMKTPHLMRDIFGILEQANIEVHMLSYSTSNINLSMVLLSRDVRTALELFHAHFFV